MAMVRSSHSDESRLDEKVVDTEKATDRFPEDGEERHELETENFALKKGLKGRHMQMIAIGGSIGMFRATSRMET